MQPLWNPAPPQPEQRHLIPSGSFFLFLPWLSGKTIFSESQFPGAGGRNGSVTCYRTIGINWNFGTLGTCIRLKRFERSEAIERLERFEPGGFVLVSVAVERFDRSQGRLLKPLEQASLAKSDLFTSKKRPKPAIYTIFNGLINRLCDPINDLKGETIWRKHPARMSGLLAWQ